MSQTILALLAFRNEAYYLPDYFASLEPYVNGFLCVDDNSEDASYEIARAHKRVISIYRRSSPAPAHSREVENRRYLLEQAYIHGADYVLVLDADERMSTAFLKSMPTLARAESKPVYHVHVRDLWNSPIRYRIDPPWNTKVKPVFIPSIFISEYHDEWLHQVWTPPELMAPERQITLDADLYHLRSIHAHDRRQRVEKFKQIDPHGRNSGFGYDYLNDETGLVTKEIAQGRRYYPLAQVS